MSLDHDLFIHEVVDFERKFFVAERGISIFPKIGAMVEESVFLDHYKAYLEVMKGMNIDSINMPTL